MITSSIKRALGLIRQALGISQLQAAIRESGNATSAYTRYLEDRSRTLAALSMPSLNSEDVTQKDILRFCALFQPSDVEDFKKIRLGNRGDGGYIFIDDFAPISQVISCGISDDVNCDLAFAEMGKRVVQFDHTVETSPQHHPRFDFRKQAIDALGSIPGSVRLWDVVNKLGDAGKADLLLKIDIDGNEWATFANFPLKELKRIRQIVCEFHWSSRLHRIEHFTLCLKAIENIRKAFFPAHLHANNFAGFANVLGVPIPEVYEVTFVNNDLYRPSGFQKSVPTELDSPNNPNFPDLFLGSPFRIS
jgi:hypothetical protein